jgi:hypothetical protein
MGRGRLKTPFGDTIPLRFPVAPFPLPRKALSGPEGENAGTPWNEASFKRIFIY